MKKIFTIVLVIAILVALGGFNWYKGTPAYSLNQLRTAISNHDIPKALSYFDTDLIFESIWSQSTGAVQAAVESRVGTSNNPLLDRFAGQLPAIEQQAIASAKPIAKQKFVQILTRGLTDPKPKETNGSITITGALDEKPEVKIVGDTATITIPKGVSLIMKKQADRSWKITDIQGIFKASSLK